MNIIENLTRIKEGKDNIIKSLKNKGVDINDNTLINEIPTIIDNAEIGGGGGDTPVQPDVPELVQKYEGATVFRINVPTDNYEFAINLCNDATKATYDVDWGDGILESGLTTDEQHHTYSKAGIYDVNVYNISKDITLGKSFYTGKEYLSTLFNNTNNDFWNYGYINIKDNTIKNVLIGNKIISIGDYAFNNCSNLHSITISNTVTSIGNNAFQQCGNLHSVNISESVTSIGQSAFSNCRNLNSITIPNSVTKIVQSAFEYCSNLISLTFSEGVQSIGQSAFNNCSSLISVTIPKSITSIGSSVFQNCSNLHSVNISESITSIGSSAFSNCTSLQSITCNTLTAPTIQTNSFPTSNLKYTKRYLYIPKESTGYDSGNFKTYLIDKGWELRYIEDRVKTPTTLKLKTKNNFFQNIVAIGQAKLVDYELVDNEYIYYFDDKITELISNSFYNDVLEEIELPEGVEVLGTNLFSNGLKLSKVNIPSTVTSIGESCFYRNPITELTIPEGITSLPKSMCDSCKLNTINIPSTVTSIDRRCFMYNTTLKTITCKAMTAPTIQSDTFSSIATSGTRVLRVPEGSLGYNEGYWKSQLSGFTLEYVPLSEL